MTSGRIGCAIAALAVFCVLGIFFFPAVQGPYPAVYGPVTALLALRASTSLRVSMMSAGLNVVRSGLNSFRNVPAMLSLFLLCIASSMQELISDPPSDLGFILRC